MLSGRERNWSQSNFTPLGRVNRARRRSRSPLQQHRRTRSVKHSRSRSRSQQGEARPPVKLVEGTVLQSRQQSTKSMVKCSNMDGCTGECNLRRVEAGLNPATKVRPALCQLCNMVFTLENSGEAKPRRERSEASVQGHGRHSVRSPLAEQSMARNRHSRSKVRSRRSRSRSMASHKHSQSRVQHVARGSRPISPSIKRKRKKHHRRRTRSALRQPVSQPPAAVAAPAGPVDESSSESSPAAAPVPKKAPLVKVPSYYSDSPTSEAAAVASPAAVTVEQVRPAAPAPAAVERAQPAGAVEQPRPAAQAPVASERAQNIQAAVLLMAVHLQPQERRALATAILLQEWSQ